MRVLVVEDEEMLARSLQSGLEAEGIAVDVANDGETGLWLAREHPHDVIILDVMLPKMNGFKVCQTLRDDGNWTPILMLTAKAGEWDEVEGLDTGADDYLTKPFSFSILLARLRALTRRGPIERPTVITVGDLALDPAAQTVKRNGAAIDLTAKEFAVVYFLMRQSGLVVSKTQIVENVWDIEFDGDLNIVEVYIRSIRKKLGVELVETIRGAGYRFVAS